MSKCWIDGSLSALCVVIEHDNWREIVTIKGKFATGNQAEYYALIRALTIAVDENAEDLEIYSDSQLLVRQFNGQYAVKNQTLQALLFTAKALANSLKTVKVGWVRREENPAGKELG